MAGHTLETRIPKSIECSDGQHPPARGCIKTDVQQEDISMAGLKRLVLAQRLACGLKTLIWPVVVVFSSVGWGQGEMPTPGNRLAVCSISGGCAGV